LSRVSKRNSCVECGKLISEEESEKLGGFYCKDCFMKIDQILREKKIQMAIKLSKTQPVVMRQENGKPYFAFTLPTIIEVVEDKSEKPDVKKFLFNINLGQSGLKRIGDLLGMAGFYYDAEYYWETTPENVINAWNWFSQKTQANDDYWDAVEGDAVRDFLDNNWNPLPNPMTNEFRDSLTLHILSLIIDLYALDKIGVDVSKKLSEIKRHMKGQIESYEKLSSNIEFPTNFKVSRNAMSRVTNLRMYLANLSAESSLARLAKIYGFNVILAVHPDLIINGKKVDVKKPVDRFTTPKNRDFLTSIPEDSAVMENLSNHIREGFRQKVDIVAIKVNHLDKRPIKGFNPKWLTPSMLLKNAIQNAINYDKKGIVLLFTENSKGYFGRVLRCKKIRK
jgi:hypothetical protein